MTTPWEIPLSPKPQRLAISLAGVRYQLRTVWNVFANCWMLDIADSSGTAIVSSVPLVAGVDLLDQLHYFVFGGYLYATTDGNANLPPTYADLGLQGGGHLIFVTP